MQKYILLIICGLIFVDSSPSEGVIHSVYEGESIQTVIDESVDGDTILVHPGTYIENLTYDGKNIVVGSLFLTTRDTSYLAQTIIDGNQEGPCVAFENGEDTTAVLTGFTITNGSGHLVPPYMTYGGGIWCFNEASPRIHHNIITQNTAGDGGGIYCRGVNAQISHNTIRHNEAREYGGGVACFFSDAVLKNNQITHNSAGHSDLGGGGGGFYFSGANPVLINNIVSYNTVLNGNGGGFDCLNSHPELNNNLITFNTADWGGGIYCRGRSAPILTNTTLSHNTADAGGGIYCRDGSMPTLENSICWQDTPQEVFFDSLLAPNAITISYSDMEGGQAGIETNDNGTIHWLEGNLVDDPLFVDSENGDYHLQIDSPCIDAGNPDDDANDACLPPGLNTERNDMGAYGGVENCGWIVRFRLAGMVGYWLMCDLERGVPMVSLLLSGDVEISIETNADGNYHFENVPAGHLTLTPQKEDDDHGISPLDAAWVAQYAAGMREFDECPLIAADVSGNGEITSFDAAKIARYCAGMVHQSRCATWFFQPVERVYSPLEQDRVAENFTAILYGEVTGNWQP